jgi:hypothetical protein
MIGFQSFRSANKTFKMNWSYEYDQKRISKWSKLFYF